MKRVFILVFISLFSLCMNADDRPNVIYINIDDLGWSDLSYMGSQYYETPHIDALAKSGMRFTNAYAPAANCAPSRACTLTGQNTPRHGVYTVLNSDRGKAKDRKIIPIKNTLHIKESNKTIAYPLKQAGYATATMGKWHVTNNPLKNDFDVNYGGTKSGGPYTGGYLSPYKYPNMNVKEKGKYLPAHLTDLAIDWINEQKAKQKKFFLYLPYFSVHTPLQAPQGIIEKYKKKAKTKEHFNPVMAAMIEGVDTNIGRLVESLKKEGLFENTLIIFSSDNGGIWKISRQWPLRSGKGSYYEGGIRVPTFIVWPKNIPANVKSDAIVSGLDFYPTIVAATKSTLPDKPLDGENILPLLTAKKKADPNRALYFHFPIYLQAYAKNNKENGDFLFRTRPGSAMRIGKWKMHHYFENDTYELYDLSNDPSEKSNVAEQNPELLSKLKQKLDKWRKEMNAPIPTERNPKYKGK